MNFKSVQLACEKNITSLKFPPHTTDIPQPLEKSVFKSLKDHWESVLFKRLHLKRPRLTKAEFTTLLVSQDVWDASVKVGIIYNDFRRCDIFPCDRNTYLKDKLNRDLLNRYKTLIEKLKL